jgi:2-polyprenyl-3-methyl-5-hydroxy-6-metoxy-1,4-benzoquinol methylase
MEKITDWVKLWQELSEINNRRREKSKSIPRRSGSVNRARSFDDSVKQRWQKPDSSRDFFLSQITEDSTVLDIGAGSGAWSILAARRARHVTALEPDTDMLDVMQNNIASEGIKNIRIIQATWPDVVIEPHDITLCSHAMYGATDLPKFIRQMECVTRKMCFMLIRQPSLNGVMAKAAQHILGQPYDSPNFVIAYNILFQMDIYANVLVEDSGLWRSWTHKNLEDALMELKIRLGLDNNGWDEELMNLLKSRLKFENGKYIWPPAVYSALIYWKPTLS